MTTRRRNTRSSRRGRRTGRDVWVNHDVNFSLTNNNISNFDLLTNAKDFMLFDTTITSVIIEDLHFSFDSLAPAGLRRIAIGLITGNAELDSTDFTSPLVDGVGPPWMVMLTSALNLSGVAPQNMTLTKNGPMTIRSKRRFKENDSTLFMVIHNISPAVDTTLLLSGIIRTLIHVP